MYLGVFRHKQGNVGDGGLLTGLSWEQLTEKRKQFAEKAYLADVETYADSGRRKFVAVWRAGKGNGALYWYREWANFEIKAKELNRSQQLIDFERFITGDGKWNYLGVWKAGVPSDALLRSLSAADLVLQRKQRRPMPRSWTSRSTLPCRRGSHDHNRPDGALQKLNEPDR